MVDPAQLVGAQVDGEEVRGGGLQQVLDGELGSLVLVVSPPQGVHLLQPLQTGDDLLEVVATVQGEHDQGAGVERPLGLGLWNKSRDRIRQQTPHVALTKLQ